MTRRALLAAALVAAAGGAASADPALDRVSSQVTKARRLDVQVEATLGAAGEVTIDGTVNGTPVHLRKRGRPGSRTYRLRVDPRKLRLRRLAVPLRFDLMVHAREGGGAETAQALSASIPVPCVLLPGFGDERVPGRMDAFAAGMNLAAGGAYSTDGDHPTLVVYDYPSLTESLAANGRGLDRTVRTALKGTPFGKVDLVGYSYGGVVARSFLAQRGGTRVRTCVFLASPNEGTPLAYLGASLFESGQLATVLAANPQIATALGGFVTDETAGALRNLYPTYDWALMPGLFPPGSMVPVPPTLLQLAGLGDPFTPLTELNRAAPPSGVAFHAVYYTSTPGGAVGTVDVLDISKLTGLVGGGTIDPAEIATGDGDGLVAAHSVRMDDEAAWAAAIADHPLTDGTHFTLLADPRVIVEAAQILGQ